MSGELQRLAAQARVASIFRTHGGLLQAREGKELQRDRRELTRRGVLAKAEVAVHTDVAEEAMDAAAEINNYRRARAGGDETADYALSVIQGNHLRAVSRSQRNVDNDLI